MNIDYDCEFLEDGKTIDLISIGMVAEDGLGNPELPSLPGVTEHNALGDAREVRYRREWLAAHHGERSAI